MATEDIVGGLFGLNPDMYRQQQQQQVFNRAVALQNLDPFQQAAVGYQQAGYNLAGALGGALGGVDPQLQRISTLNAISKQIDQTNPESMLQGAKLLADAGFTQEALGLAQYARKANSELALAEQRRKEGRAAGANKDIEIAEYAANLRVVLDELKSGPQTADTPRQIALLEARLEGLPQKEVASTEAIKNATAIANLSAFPKGTPQYIKIVQDEMARLTERPDKQSQKVLDARRAGEIVSKLANLKSLPKEQQNQNEILALEAELDVLNPPKAEKISAFAQTLLDRGLKPNSTEFNSQMDAYIKKQTTESKGVIVQNLIPGQDKLVNIPEFRNSVQKTIDGQLKIVNATDNALLAIDDSIKTNNFVSFRAAQVQLTRAISGGDDLSRDELKAAGADPSFTGGVADYLSKLASSTPTLDTQNKIRKVLLALRKKSVDKARVEVAQQRKIAELSNYPKEALDAALTFPELKPYQAAGKETKAAKTYTTTTKAGKSVTITEVETEE